MRLDTPFYRLPLHFDARRLAEEVSQFGEKEWKPHPQGYPGNSAISLLAVGGDPSSDAVKGPMQPTPYLARCPYIRQVLGSLETVLGRTRLMRLSGQSEATAHVDMNYYWMHHVRIHIPAVTFPEVRFLCGGASVHMAAGECWIFDSWRLHNVLNPGTQARIHLVADTVGSLAFWDLVAGAERPADPRPETTLRPRLLSYEPGHEPDLAFESANFPVVMTPWEQECLIAEIVEDLMATDADEAVQQRLRDLLLRFNRHWRHLWAQFGAAERGWPAYRQALEQLQGQVAPFAPLRLPNNVPVVEALQHAVVYPAVNPELTSARPAAPASRFDRPVIIVAAPRSGSSLLFETLARSPDVWTIGGESHEIIEGIAKLQPANRNWDSNRLTAEDADAQTAATLHAAFLARLRNRDGKAPPEGTSVRLLEKTPKNALRIPFLNAIFPDALFIYLYREPRENISSILDAWRSRKFVTYPKLPEWPGPPWSLLLIPQWRKLRGKTLAEAAATQYRATHEQILADLAALPAGRWTAVGYQELLDRPQETIEKLCRFAGLRWDQKLEGSLPLSRHTLTPPDPEKWRRNADEMAPVLPGVEGVAGRVRALLSDSMPATPEAPAEQKDLGAEPLACIATNNFPQILSQLGMSLVISTYQAGKLIFVRADGDRLNTHFRAMQTPMGVALHQGRLAVGTKSHLWEFWNQPEVGKKLDPPNRHDACFVPRRCHFTGDIRIHEIVYGAEELWIVNTRFSCLCTIDDAHNFVPRWRPPWVTALAPEDRCHLNGLALEDGTPAYVTCLGRTDTPNGWRENKRNGGVLVSVRTGEVLLSGLSMPHSPRCVGDRLWLLESGEGAIGFVDPDTGKLKNIAHLPGFTRGIDFAGNLAFVGLSQVRETAVFSGLPLTERAEERACGVWVVDVRNGQTVAFLKFTSGVQEIFAVQVMPNTRFPDLINEDEELLSNSFILPTEALADVPIL